MQSDQGSMSLEENLNKVKSLKASKIPSQQRQVALLEGIELTLREENQELNAVAYFSALLSLLDRQDAIEPATELLAYVVPFVSNTLLASKIDVIVNKLSTILLNDSGTALARSSISVLEALLISVSQNAWTVPISQLGAQRTFSGVLTLAQDSRPKIRKRALEAVKRILVQGKGGHRLAFDASITAVEASLSADNKQKLVHSLQLLKSVLASSPSLSTAQIDGLLPLLLRVVRGADQYTVLAVFDAMENLPKDDSRITQALLSLAPDVSDKQIAPAWLASIASRKPPILEVFGKISVYLTSDQPEVVESAGQCMIALISDSLNPRDLHTVESLATEHLFPLLQVRFHGAWSTVCEVCAAFIATLPYELAPKSEGVLNIVRVVGALRTTANEADQVIGAAIRVLGPEIVCKLVPLQLDARSGKGRAWLLPLLAEHIVHTNIAFYFAEIVPLAAQFESEAAKSTETRRGKVLQTISDQLFTLFPRFCDECQDTFSVEQLQEVLGWLYSRPIMRPSICLGLKLYVETARNAEPFVALYGADVLKALLNVFQAMNVDSRGYVLEAVDAYLAALPTEEITQLFNQISTMLAQNLGDVETRHTLMDIINAIVPYLSDSAAETLFNLFKAVGSMDDALMQKKAYRVLTRFEPGLGYRVLAPTLLELQQTVMPNARRTRLQALGLVGERIPEDGDFSFVFKTLPEAILGVKDPNEKTRDAAFSLLLLYGQRMLTAKGGFVDHSQISELENDDSKPAATIIEYFEMIMAGLAGNTPHMVAATVTALARVFYEFHSQLTDDKLLEYIDLVWMLLESPNREIVTAVLGFVKVSILIMPSEQLNQRLAPLLSLLLTWSNEHKNHFKGKVKHLIERLLRRCGYETLEAAFPESEKKLLQNIHKSKERSRRKRAQASGESDEQSSEAAHIRTRKFDNEFDEALYGSDSDEDDEDGPTSDNNNRKNSQASRHGKYENSQNRKSRKEQFIVGGSDPLDLLDERALSYISNTKPNKQGDIKKMRHQLPETKDGKLVIGRNVEAEKEKATADALAAYMDAVREGPVRGQNGKLKYRRGKKARQDDQDADDEPADSKPKNAGRVTKKVNFKKHMKNRKRL